MGENKTGLTLKIVNGVGCSLLPAAALTHNQGETKMTINTKNDEQVSHKKIIRGYFNIADQTMTNEAVKRAHEFANIFAIEKQRFWKNDLPKSKALFISSPYDDTLFIHKKAYHSYMFCYEQWRNPDYILSI